MVVSSCVSVHLMWKDATLRWLQCLTELPAFKREEGGMTSIVALTTWHTRATMEDKGAKGKPEQSYHTPIRMRLQLASWSGIASTVNQLVTVNTFSVLYTRRQAWSRKRLSALYCALSQAVTGAKLINGLAREQSRQNKLTVSVTPYISIPSKDNRGS